MHKNLMGAALLFAAANLTAASVQASAFVAWQVTNVPFGDTLNVRKYPASYSQKQSAYPNGTILSMTGRCTGGVNLKNIQHLPKRIQASRIRTLWCEVWHDPAQNGEYLAGWVYGRYIKSY